MVEGLLSSGPTPSGFEDRLSDIFDQWVFSDTDVCVMCAKSTIKGINKEGGGVSGFKELLDGAIVILQAFQKIVCIYMYVCVMCDGCTVSPNKESRAES